MKKWSLKTKIIIILFAVVGLGGTGYSILQLQTTTGLVKEAALGGGAKAHRPDDRNVHGVDTEIS